MKKQLLTFLTIAMAFAMNAQITLLKDINDGSGNSFPANMTTFNGKIYFAADDSSGSNTGGTDYGKELWITDGTPTGTVLVKDLNTGSSSSTPNFFFVLNGSLYFSANSGAGNVLFTTDGTESGTIPTGDPFIFNQVELGGLIYFVLTTDANKLHQFDGSSTTAVSNLGTGTEAVIGANIVAFDNKIFCYMDYSEDEPTIGRELYAYDPATDMFTLIKDVTGNADDAGISNFTVVGNELYFEAGSGILWKTDGTTGGTMAVSAAASLSGVTSLFNWNDKLYFEGDNGTSGDQLWVYDPIANTITNVSNITGGTNNDHNPSDYAILDGRLYYVGQVADDSTKFLFRTDGVVSERVSSAVYDIDDIAVLNGKLYFEGDNGTSGNELYSLDPATLSVDGKVAEITNVFPNPTSDYIMVSKNLINAPYSIYEATGKLIKQGTITSEKIQLDLNSGLYLFKIKTNNSIVTKKIVVK